MRAIHIWLGEKITEYERTLGNIPYPEEVDSRIEGIMNNNILLHFCYLFPSFAYCSVPKTIVHSALNMCQYERHVGDTGNK
jgi:hypothetical protein